MLIAHIMKKDEKGYEDNGEYDCDDYNDDDDDDNDDDDEIVMRTEMISR